MDILTCGLLNKKVEEAKNVSGEKITEAVNAYLDDNPPTTGATAEQAAQIDKNVGDIGELKQDLTDIESAVIDKIVAINKWKPTEIGAYYSQYGKYNISEVHSYQILSVKEGDIINVYYWKDGQYTVQDKVVQIFTAYSGDTVQGVKGLTNAQTYTVPSGVDKVIVNINTGQYTDNICVCVNNTSIPTEKQEYAESNIVKAKTDKTLSIENVPADAKKVGEELNKKQTKLIAGNGISIDENGTISYIGSEQSGDAKSSKYIHVSIDDCVFWSDLIANENTYTSCFQNEKLAKLKEWHDNYGICVTCNCFIIDGEYSIADITSKFANEFKENKDWLRFAFHGYDGNTTFNTDMVETITEYYNTFTTAIIKMTGDAECIDRVTRTQSFTGTLANCLALRDCAYGVNGFECFDLNNMGNSYYLDNDKSTYIRTHCKYYDSSTGLWFIGTMPRIEAYDYDVNIFESAEYSNFYPILEFFFHENTNWWFSSKETRTYIPCWEYFKNNGFKFAFTQDVLCI